MECAMTATIPQIDIQKAQGFAFKVLADTTANLIGTLHLVGDRLELFDTLKKFGPATAEQFAEVAEINARYAREWLSAMACHGYIDYDAGTETFSIPIEHAMVISEKDSPIYIGGLIRTQPDFWANVDALTEAFVNGGGVPQCCFGDEWRCGFERFSRPGFVNNLANHWIPALDSIEERLKLGGSVIDVGCGNGQAAIQMALAYPEASVIGIDVFPAAIESARENAETAGVGDRVRFEVHDVAEGLPGSYDLITCFDVIHDLPRPIESMQAMRAALNPGGSLFVLEFNLSSDLQENIEHPLGMGAFGYAASVNYCMTTSLAVDGAGTGTCLGERCFREFAAEAGFTSVQRHDFPTNPFNLFFEARG
jgi:2-polyprenyl-3-methyl-5-hydroxy-6-metoxy-1,4-benzoquinol methylase